MGWYEKFDFVFKQRIFYTESTKTAFYLRKSHFRTVVAIAWYENKILSDWTKFSILPS